MRPAKLLLNKGIFVKPLKQKYFSLPELRFTVLLHPARAAMRDVSRSSRSVVWVAMGRS
jgi:hypothetical protein